MTVLMEMKSFLPFILCYSIHTYSVDYFNLKQTSVHPTQLTLTELLVKTPPLQKLPALDAVSQSA